MDPIKRTVGGFMAKMDAKSSSGRKYLHKIS